jgi:uncharacterized ubiquitin-like protein YukD
LSARGIAEGDSFLKEISMTKLDDVITAAAMQKIEQLRAQGRIIKISKKEQLSH